MGNPYGEQIYGQDGGQSSIDNGQNESYTGGQAQGSGYNPNFQPLLADIPQDLHEKVLPHLQQWDKGVNDRFEKLQSDYAPWKSVFSSGATPDQVNNGLALMNLLDTNPEALYKALADNYKFGQQQDPGTGQGQTPPNQQALEDVPDYVKNLQNQYGQMEQNFTTLAQHVLEQRKQEAEAREDKTLANEFKAAHDKIGDFDDNWVKAQCLANLELSVEQAAQQYKQWENSLLAKHGARPILMGSSGGGGVPGQGSVDVTKLNGQQTRGLAASMIRQMRASQD